MKESTVIFGSVKEIVEQTRNPRLIEKCIEQNQPKLKKQNNKNKARVSLPKNQTNNFGK